MEQDFREELDYGTSKEKLVSFLSDSANKHMVLGTSAKGRVMTRVVLIVSDGLDIYFFTWRRSRKIAQIEKNNWVSLCKDKVEIEGEASILGPMRSKENEGVLELFREKFPGAVERWEVNPAMVFVRISPNFACIDGYFMDNDSYLEYLDLEKQESYRVKWAHY